MSSYKKTEKKKVCVVCEKTFTTTNSIKKFCSLECKTINQKKYNGTKPDGNTWDMICEYINERDKYKCTSCGTPKKPLYVHHIKYLCKKGTNEPNNLTTLCGKCHAEEHKFDYTGV